MHVFNRQQSCHSLHIQGGINTFLPSFEILTKKHLDPGDVRERFAVAGSIGTIEAKVGAGTLLVMLGVTVIGGPAAEGVVTGALSVAVTGDPSIFTKIGLSAHFLN